MSYPKFYRDKETEYLYKVEGPHGGKGHRMVKDPEVMRYEFFNFGERTMGFINDPENDRMQEIVKEDFVAALREFLKWLEKNLRALEG